MDNRLSKKEKVLVNAERFAAKLRVECASRRIEREIEHSYQELLRKVNELSKKVHNLSGKVRYRDEVISKLRRRGHGKENISN